jgi:hypothetical protein
MTRKHIRPVETAYQGHQLARPALPGRACAGTPAPACRHITAFSAFSAACCAWNKAIATARCRLATPGYAWRFRGSSKDVRESFGHALSSLALGAIFIFMILA